MWIRSQDKTELINTKRIQVDGKGVYAFEGVAIEDCNYIKMGVYKSHEKAIEVLDKIQNQLTSISNVRESQNDSELGWLKTEYSEVVYQMPEEEK